VFRLESWSIFIPSEGVRAGNKIIRTVLTPLSDIPHITETIDVSIEEKDSVLDEDYSWSKDELEELSKLSKAELLKRAKAWAPSYTASHVNALRRTRKEDTRQKKIVALIEDHTCQVCGFFCEYKNLKGRRRFLIHIDHIEEKNKKGDERLENLWALCPNCHAKKTAGIIKIDLKKKKVFDNETEIAIRDSHLFL
jgi:predicted restriction endonuclease